MKFSEKGLKKLERHEQIKKLGYVSLIDEIEFEPDDFEDCVVLTLKEAKGLKVYVEALMKEQGTFEQWKSFDLLCKRILKAEGK